MKKKKTAGQKAWKYHKTHVTRELGPVQQNKARFAEYKTIYARGGQLEDLWTPYFRRQLEQQPVFLFIKSNVRS